MFLEDKRAWAIEERMLHLQEQERNLQEILFLQKEFAILSFARKKSCN